MNVLGQFADKTRTDELDPVKLSGRTFTHVPHVIWTIRRGETVIFDIERGRYECLNDVATSVWELVVVGASFERIVEGIQNQYEVLPGAPTEQMVREVAALIGKLIKARILVTDTN